MSDAIPLNSSTYAPSFVLADLDLKNGVKTLFATVTSVSQVLPAALNGAAMIGGNTGKFKKLPRTLSITTTADAATYNVASPIVVTGKYGGKVVTESFALTQAGGGETIYGNQPFEEITSIDIPAQTTTNGEFTIGVADLCPRGGESVVCRRIKATADGNIGVQWDRDGTTDRKEAYALLVASPVEDIAPVRITRANTTVAGFRLYT